MKKLKKIYRENRVLFILMIVVVVCFIVMLFALVKLFFGSSGNKYGNRLDSIDNMEISKTKSDEVITKIKKEALVSDAKITTMGKIVYLTIYYNVEATLDDAKTIAAKSFESLEENITTNYDFNFTIIQEKSDTTDGFMLMGAKNANSANLKWNNNREVIEKEDE